MYAIKIKRSHSMPFPPSTTTQPVYNVRVLITSSQCHKPHIIYSKHKLSGNQIASLKKLLKDSMYVCRTIYQDVPLDDQCLDTRVAEHVFTRENISCKSNVELPYSTLQLYKKISIRCGRSNGLQLTNSEVYPQCNRCNDPPVKRTKRKSFTKK